MGIVPRLHTGPYVSETGGVLVLLLVPTEDSTYNLLKE